jgi:hypothetical protein
MRLALLAVAFCVFGLFANYGDAALGLASSGSVTQSGVNFLGQCQDPLYGDWYYVHDAGTRRVRELVTSVIFFGFVVLLVDFWLTRPLWVPQ